MRFKKGFTLAEILIVLMVIGVIATLTVPSMMKNVNEAQMKTSYKKAYNTITNLWAMLSVEGTAPVRFSDTISLNKVKYDFFVSMLENLSVREITEAGPNSGTVPDVSDSDRSVTYEVNGVEKTVGSGTDAQLAANIEPEDLWITTDDGISYLVEETDGLNCNTKQVLNTKTTGNTAATAAIADSCITLIADVNGINKRPNTMEVQVTGGIGVNGAGGATNMDTLQGDQYYIYIARDGVTAGNKNNFATARIIADVK